MKHLKFKNISQQKCSIFLAQKENSEKLKITLQLLFLAHFH